MKKSLISLVMVIVGLFLILFGIFVMMFFNKKDTDKVIEEVDDESYSDEINISRNTNYVKYL